jgi:hypothetical protein
MKREALELHSIEMEKSTIWGIPTENTGANGKPERTTGGLVYWINTYASDNTADYTAETGSDYAGKSWLEAGEKWLNTELEQVFRYGSQEKLALAGSGALLGINELAYTTGQIQLVPGATDYGIRVTTWQTPFGVLQIKTHPLFSYEPTNRRSMIILEPKNMRFRYIRDTRFLKDAKQSNTNQSGKDSVDEEWLTEGGYEFNQAKTFGYLNGIGSDNSN